MDNSHIANVFYTHINMITVGKITPRVTSNSRSRTPTDKISTTTSIHIFDVARFNDVVANTTGSHVIPEIDMAAIQTGSNTISAHRTARDKIPTVTLMVSRSSSSMVINSTRWQNWNFVPIAPTAIFLFPFTNMSKQFDSLVTRQKFHEN